MAERDLLKEAQEWYEKHTKLVPADFLDRSMGKPEYLYVGFLLAFAKGLADKAGALNNDLTACQLEKDRLARLLWPHGLPAEEKP